MEGNAGERSPEKSELRESRIRPKNATPLQNNISKIAKGVMRQAKPVMVHNAKRQGSCNNMNEAPAMAVGTVDHGPVIRKKNNPTMLPIPIIAKGPSRFKRAAAFQQPLPDSSFSLERSKCYGH